VKVVIDNLSLAGRTDPLTNLLADFALTLFEEGHNYIFTVDLKNIHFAGSNIYWDNSSSKLTFEPHGYTGEKSFYQGLYFKWGSLVGISGKNGLLTTSGMLYYPTDDNNCTAITLSASSYSNFSGIPRLAIPSTGGGTTSNYVTTYNGGVPNYVNRWGDICRWIDGNYRLPKAEETISSSLINNWTSAGGMDWHKGTDALGDAITFPAASAYQNNVLEEDGSSVLVYVTYANFGAGFATAPGGVVIPASGFMANGGYRYNMAVNAYYWTSSHADATNIYYFGFDDEKPRLTVIVPTAHESYPIRCVKN
jgi:hypothetical protein